MASSTFRVATLPPAQVPIRKSSSTELTARATRPFQVRCVSELEAPKTLSVTRRDALLCFTTLSATGIALSSPQIAEARITKAEMRKKIKEKFEMLREKLGLSKRKEIDEGKLPSVPTPSAKKDKNLALEPPPLPLPNPPKNLGKSLVQANLL